MDTGWLNPSAAASVDIGSSFDWSNTANVYSSNNSRALAGPIFAIPNRLGVKGFNASLPAGARIVGLEVGVEGYLASSSAETLKVKLYKNPYTVSPAAEDVSDEKTAAFSSETEQVYEFGGAADTWGEAFTASNVNSSNFGIGVEFSSLFNTVYIDHVKLKVHYVLSGNRVQFIGY